MLQEPGVVALKDGRILMFMRNNSGYQYISYSSDQGESWSSAEPSTIKSPRSPASIERIPSTGDLLMVWNNNDGKKKAISGKRTPFNTAISRDDGKTWQMIPMGGTVILPSNLQEIMYYLAIVQETGRKIMALPLRISAE